MSKLKRLIKKNWITLLLATGVILLVISQAYVIKGQLSKSDNKDDAGFTAEINLEDLSAEELSAAKAYVKFKQIKDSFVPSGVPEVYGQELNISFDEVQDAINKVRVYGPTYGEEGKKIPLEDFTEDELQRYKDIGASISCKYCCGVTTLTKDDGTASCGCAHSIMMRGLSAYLIKNHPEMSNTDVLNELSDWLKTYFPKQTLSAELQRMEDAGETGIKEILQEFPDFLPQMVGGC